MDSTGTPTWVLLVGFAVTIAVAIVGATIAGRSTVRASKVAADEGAFVRATDIFEAGQQELKDRVERIATDLAETRKDLKAARVEISTLRRSVSQYEGRVIQLEVVLRMHNIEIPPWTLMPADFGMLPGSIPDPNQPPHTTEVAEQ